MSHSGDATSSPKACRQCGSAILPGVMNFKRKRYCGNACAILGRTHTPEQVLAAFWSRVDKTASCWLWNGYRQPDGYGQCRANGKFYNSHKYAYELANGPVPAGMELMHSCDVRHCVNPAHMSIGTHEQNVADTFAKGRTTRGERSATARLTAAQVLEIRKLRAEGHGPKDLAARYGVRPHYIWQLCSRQTWKHI